MGMTDFYHPSTPVSQSAFRDNTAKQSVMAGVNKIPALDRCVCCGKRRTAKSGAYKRAGFFCHGCK